MFVLLGLSLRSLWLRDGMPLKAWPEPFPLLGATLGSFALTIVAVAVICALWLVGRLLERPGRAWQWGRLVVFLPLLGLSMVVVANLSDDRIARSSGEIPKLLAFTWFVYMFVVNERPNVTIPLGLAASVQGAVTILQAFLQRDLGLRAIGERLLSVDEDGISILWVHDQAWIRPYGFTDHPNWLGAALAVCLLLLVSVFERARGLRRWAVGIVILLSFLGLLLSFSRAAWIGFGVGVIVRFAWRHGARASCPSPVGTASGAGPDATPGRLGRSLALPYARVLAGVLIVIALLFLVQYRDLIVSRVVLGDNPVELRSVTDRVRDAGISLRLIAEHPWRGIGAGEFLDTAQSIDPAAITVHNVTLLVTAELGLFGLIFWLCLILGTLVPWRRTDVRGTVSGYNRSAWIPPWIASLVVGLFDPNPWPLLMLISAILFGLMVGSLALGDEPPAASAAG